MSTVGGDLPDSAACRMNTDRGFVRKRRDNIYQTNSSCSGIYLLQTTEDSFWLNFIDVSSEKQHTVLFDLWDTLVLLVEGGCKAVESKTQS